MQAAGLLKERTTHDTPLNSRRVKAHRPMAKPVLVATITQDNSNVATIIREASDGMRWITTKVKVGHPTLRRVLSLSQVRDNMARYSDSRGSLQT
ncbi:hypothetical protein E2C01_099411 [Portunus trituberculatus]|uniref:Uncharacterized protein n=1 Tax=Portunus trituberculatus TaxID=210409 RepID=A0A5B7KFA8_PORTR|nr:hypothetical protein [Portunus trituberculatus]